MEQAIPDPLTQELDAMAAIGQVLGKLTDPAARQRVVRWAADRFAAGEAGGTEAAPSVAPRETFDGPVAADPSLAVDALGDMFAGRTHANAVDIDDDLSVDEPADRDAARQPIEAVLRSFAADFQRFAEAWNGAAA